MGQFKEYHGITLAENAFIENSIVESLATDPSVLVAGRSWFNSASKQYKYVGINGVGAAQVYVINDKATFDAYIALLDSQVSGEGSANIGYDGFTSANGFSTLPASQVDEAIDTLATNIDSVAQSLADLGSGSITDLQSELDAVETAVGLNANGTYAAPTGTDYLNGATSVQNADVLLDVAVKSVSDAVDQEVLDRITADNLKLNLTGGTMSGDINLNGSYLKNVPTPVDDLDAANKIYVDNAINGIDWKESVVASTLVDVALTGLLTVDSVTLEEGDRVLVRNQTNAVDNGIYVASATAWARAVDFDDSPDTEVTKGAAVLVESGTQFGGISFTLLGTDTDGTPGIQVGSDPLLFSQFTGVNDITAGVGLSRSGQQLDVNMGAGIIVLPSDEVGIDLYSASGLLLTEDGTTASTATGASLKIRPSDDTLTVDVTGVKVSDAFIAAQEVITDAIQAELDATQLSTGLNADGTFATITGNYTGSATTVAGAIQAVDTATKTNQTGLAAELVNRADADDAIQAELDVTQASTGLSATGAYIIPTTTNYLNTTSSVANAAATLDSYVKVNEVALATEVTDRTTADTLIRTNINAKKYNLATTVAALSHTITHNLGTKNVLHTITVIRADGSEVNDMGLVTLTDINTITVDFTVARNIRIVVLSNENI